MPPGSRCSSTAKRVESGSRIGRREGKEEAGGGGNKTTVLTPVVFCADRQVEP